MSTTLLLDQAYAPIQVIPWTRAITLFYCNKVEIVEVHEDKVVNSPSVKMPMPSVARLTKSFKRPKKPVKFSRQHIYARDRFSCQYCHKTLSHKCLTYDHVVPKSRGGKTDWFNIVASCRPCNTRKGDRTPEEAGMELAKKPKRPNWIPSVSIAMSYNHPKKWKDYLWG